MFLVLHAISRQFTSLGAEPPLRVCRAQCISAHVGPGVESGRSMEPAACGSHGRAGGAFTTLSMGPGTVTLIHFS